MNEPEYTMKHEPILFVSGFGRCGTTMMMTMLDAGGFPTTGPRPSYEMPDHWHGNAPDLPWLRSQGGRAVKWIDPTRHTAMPANLPEKPVIIFMTRNHKQQARSQAKVLTASASPPRKLTNALERSIRYDLPIATGRLARVAHLYILSFEDVIAEPAKTGRQIETILERHFDAAFDPTAIRVVIPRPTACARDFSMENAVLPEIAAELDKEGTA